MPCTGLRAVRCKDHRTQQRNGNQKVEQEGQTTAMERLITLLHGRECPFDFQCLATDCVECVKIHMEKEGEPEDGK